MLVRSFTLSLSRYARSILVSREFEFAAPIPSVERCSAVDRRLESSISIWSDLPKRPRRFKEIYRWDDCKAAKSGRVTRVTSSAVRASFGSE